MKYLKFVSILLSLSTYIFAFSMYGLFYRFNIKELRIGKTVLPLYYYKTTYILGEISIICALLNIVLISAFIYLRHKKQFSFKWPVINFFGSILVWLYIVVLDNSGAFAWFVD